MQNVPLPDVLMEKCLSDAISDFRDVCAPAAVCRAWQAFCTSEVLWRELACSKIPIVAAMAAKGHVPTGRWYEVARDHVATLDWSEPAAQYMIPGIKVKKHKSTTQLQGWTESRLQERSSHMQSMGSESKLLGMSPL